MHFSFAQNSTHLLSCCTLSAALSMHLIQWWTRTCIPTQYKLYGISQCFLYSCLNKVILVKLLSMQCTTKHANGRLSQTTEEITRLRWTVLPCPQYRPDLAPSDFRVRSFEECTVWAAVSWRQLYENGYKWLHDSSDKFCCVEIHFILHCWTMCIEKF